MNVNIPGTKSKKTGTKNLQAATYECEYDNMVCVTFDDLNDPNQVLGYNLYYSDAEFSASDLENAFYRTYMAADETRFILDLSHRKETKYFAVQVLGTNGTKSELSEVVQLDACAHSYETTKTIEPTCTEPGSVTYTCTVCGDSYSETIDPLGHDFGGWIVDGDNHIRSCQRDGCNAVETLPHEWNEGEVTKLATCKETGETTFTCTVCQATKNESIEKLTTHTPAEAVKENEVLSTYTEPGSYDEVVYCSVCGEELSRETIETPITDHEHQFDGAVTKEPTCKEEGITTYTCSLCGESYTETLPVVDHTDANNDGLCDMCKEKMTGDNHCKYCGKIHKGFGGFFTKIIHNILYFFSNLFGKKDKHTHNYKAVVTEPTCTQGGYTTYTCSSCGDSYTDNRVSALGHMFGDWIVNAEPTCETEGLRYHICTRCGEEVQEGIPMTAHVDEDNDGICDTCGRTIEDADEGGNPEDNNPDVNVCAYCGKEHTGVFGGITKFVHNLLYKLSGKKK